MIRIRCHTNLDLHSELWPETLPCRPMVGDYIQSLTKRGKNKYPLELRVVSIRFDSSDIIKVELHMPTWFNSIKDFEEWYRKLVFDV